MANNRLLENLVGLFHCTQQYKDCTVDHIDEEGIKQGKECMEDFVRNYEPCKSCILPKAWQNNEAPYGGKRKFDHPVPLVFFTDSLKEAGPAATGERNFVDIMVVSMDPHCYYGDIRKKIDLEKHLDETRGGKRITDVGGFIISLVGKNDWREFYDNLQGDSKTPKLYWTHLAKCNTNMNNDLAFCAWQYCKEYLKEEINFLNPRLTVALGNLAGHSLYHSGYFLHSSLFRETGGDLPQTQTMKEILDVEREIKPNFRDKELLILPHPGGNNRCYGYYMRDNSLYLKRFKQKSEDDWFNDWIEKAKQS